MATVIITTTEAYEQFEEVLNESEGWSFGGYTYSAAEILKQTDPVAYEIAFVDYVDYLAENDGIYVETMTKPEEK